MKNKTHICVIADTIYNGNRISTVRLYLHRDQLKHLQRLIPELLVSTTHAAGNCVNATLTATWQNVFHVQHTAHPKIKTLFRDIQRTLQNRTPQKSAYHIPYVGEDTKMAGQYGHCAKISASKVGKKNPNQMPHNWQDNPTLLDYAQHTARASDNPNEQNGILTGWINYKQDWQAIQAQQQATQNVPIPDQNQIQNPPEFWSTDDDDAYSPSTHRTMLIGVIIIITLAILANCFG